MVPGNESNRLVVVGSAATVVGLDRLDQEVRAVSAAKHAALGDQGNIRAHRLVELDGDRQLAVTTLEPGDVTAGEAVGCGWVDTNRDRADDRPGPIVLNNRENPLAAQLGSPLGKFVSIGAWNKLFAVAVLGVAVMGLYVPGPIPRVWFLLPIGIFLLGFLPGMGARWTSIPRFLVAAPPAFMLLGYWAAKRPRIATITCIAMMGWQLFTAYQFTRGVWAG